MKKRALVTGITGQDGAYMSKLLIEKGYIVYGTYRRLSTPNFWRLQYLGIFDKIFLIPIDFSDTTSILEALKISEPDEVYHFAAQSFVQASFETPVATGDITGLSVSRFLEALRNVAPDSKFYFASTSEMFGWSGWKKNDTEDKYMCVKCDEKTPFQPMSPYAAAKLYGYWITRIYREAYNIFAVNGILFNHESPLRGLEFVTRKISNEVAKIALGFSKELKLGNIESKRDWGYAPDYVEAVWLMMQQKEPDDYIIATGESHSVKEFVEKAFEIVGLDWKKYVKIDKRFFRPLDVPCLIGDYKKAKQKLNWSPKVKFDELVKLMVEEDIKRWSKWVEGEKFPWDAPNYPSEANILSRALRM